MDKKDQSKRREKFKIEYVNYGIANRFSGKRIEIHSKLRQNKYAPLLKEIIAHEKSHSDGGKDFVRDMKIDLMWLKHPNLYWYFFFTTPSAWIQLSPIYPSKGKAYIDTNLAVFWGCVLAISIVVSKVAGLW